MSTPLTTELALPDLEPLGRFTPLDVAETIRRALDALGQLDVLSLSFNDLPVTTGRDPNGCGDSKPRSSGGIVSRCQDSTLSSPSFPAEFNVIIVPAGPFFVRGLFRGPVTYTFPSNPVSSYALSGRKHE